MRMKSYSLEIPENLLELAEIKSRDDETNKATALQQLLYAGAERYALELVADGRRASCRAAGCEPPRCSAPSPGT